jgi:membrane dipeptidase
MEVIKSVIIFCLFSIEGILCAQMEPSDRKINRIHEKAITIDSHTDTPMWFLHGDYSFAQLHNSRTQRSKVDIPRMETGRSGRYFSGSFCWSAGKRRKREFKSKT